MHDFPVPTPEAAAARLEHVVFEVKRVVVGQERLVERVVMSLLARGHCLVEGAPGVAKTLTVLTLANAVGCEFRRIQFTPDLVPADIIGTRIYRPSSGTFEIEPGPVVANILLADELNRAPAKVQAALLEVMAERRVTLGRSRYRVPDPFCVLATQNPVESEGVHRLPEAQLDRFLFKVVVGYPSLEDEVELVQRMGVNPPTPAKALEVSELKALQRVVSMIHVPEDVLDLLVRIVFTTRDPTRGGLPELAPLLRHGAGPRASIALSTAAQALALLRGRPFVVADDLAVVAPDVLRHRIGLSFEAYADGFSADDAIALLLGRLGFDTEVLPMQLAPEGQAAG